MFWTMHSGIIAAIGTVVARYTGVFVPLGPIGTKAVAITAILALSAVNYVGVRHGSALQTAFTMGKVLAVVLIVALGFSLGGELPHFVAGAAPAGVTVRDFLLAVVAGLFAFGGWHMVTYQAEETVNPTRTIPIALLLGTLIVTVAYIAMNAVYFYVLPMDQVATSTTVAADAARALVGNGAARAMSALVIFSSFGALAGIVLSGPRVYLSMAQDGLLFRWFGAVHPRYGTPHNAIVAQAIWSSVLVATGTFRALFTRVVYTEWIFFGLLAVGLFVLRRRAGYAPPYRIWGFPVVPGVFAISCLAIVLNQIASDPKESAIGLGMVLIGLPVYYTLLKKQSATPSS
jgi:APA family basic amino acid/polyamine antiporter